MKYTYNTPAKTGYVRFPNRKPYFTKMFDFATNSMMRNKPTRKAAVKSIMDAFKSYKLRKAVASRIANKQKEWNMYRSTMGSKRWPAKYPIRK